MNFFYIGEDETFERAQEDDVGILVAGGELDFAASPQLSEGLADHINAGMTRLVLDFSLVTFIDSTAIGALVGAAVRLQENGGGSLAVVCPEENRRVLRIFEITGIESMVSLHHSREEALAALMIAG